MGKKKKPDTAFGWMEEVNAIIENARHEIELAVAEAQHLMGVQVDFVDENDNSLIVNPNAAQWLQCITRDARGDMTILINRLPRNVAAIKLSQYGK